ncbi:MAG TPA: F0F1 ATP synthase subunit delta [Stellaceae bacterium]|nr:F0F1 ATP synthase subunit delta [Stellaceae bacterium]
MAAESTGISGLAERYAAALFELADERHALDEVAGDLRELRAMLTGSADLTRLVRSPVLTRAEQGKAMAAIAQDAKLSKLTADFVGVVAGNRRLFAVPAMIEAYLAKLAERRGEVTAEITAAQALSEAQQNSLIDQLRRVVGSRVAIDVTIDPSLLGGLVVKIGSRLVDGSLKGQLQRLQLSMKGIG